MNAERDELTIEQILVALDASPHSVRALAAAIALAQELRARLMGIYVEDTNLLKLATLPFATEIRYPRATVVRLNRAKMEAQLRHQAEQAREKLQEMAEEASLQWSFRVARGSVASELLTAALDADLLVLGRISRSLLAGRGLGSTAQAALAQARHSVLLSGSVFDLNRPIAVIFDGSDLARRALLAATDLAQISGQLCVLIWPDEHGDVEDLLTEVNAYLGNSQLNLTVHQPADQASVAKIIETSDSGLVVATTQQVQQLLVEVIDELEQPILVVS